MCMLQICVLYISLHLKCLELRGIVNSHAPWAKLKGFKVQCKLNVRSPSFRLKRGDPHRMFSCSLATIIEKLSRYLQCNTTKTKIG